MLKTPFFAAFLLLSICIGRVAAQSSPAVQTPPTDSAQAHIEFEHPDYDFGSVPEGTVVEFRYIFKNTGNAPLQLSMVRPSCGCISPMYTQDPVPPGGKGYVEVKFMTQGRPGSAYKSITVMSNAAENPVVLKLRGNILPQPSTPATNDAPLTPPVRRQGN